MDYEYIIGARLKNESEKIKKQILKKQLGDGQMMKIKKQIKAGKLTKSNINNRSHNKYLKLKGDVSIEIDY